MGGGGVAEEVTDNLTSPLAVSRHVGGTRSSAVCAFSLKDIKSVFEGKYKELDKETSRWTTYEYPDISPRPGSVSIIHAMSKARLPQTHMCQSTSHSVIVPHKC